MISALEWIGRHARGLLLAGLVLVPLLPSTGGALVPLLPVLIAVLTGMALSRLDPAAIVVALADRRVLRPLGLGLVLFQPVAGAGLYLAGRGLGLDAGTVLLLVAFAASPPLTSGPNIALMLGYEGRLALLYMLAGTVLSPLMVPALLWGAGMELPTAPGAIAGRVFWMLAGGVVLGIVLRRTLGARRIAEGARAFDGVAAILMVVFLVPVLDGVWDRVLADPARAGWLAMLGVALNLGGNLAVRGLAGRMTTPGRARTLGLLFGNRNISVLLAALPFQPDLALFVALGQIPIYATPAILSALDRRSGKGPGNRRSGG